MSNVISLKQKKEERELSRGRMPLHISHLNGKVTGSPHLNRDKTEAFSERMQNIKTALEKINALMADLKKSEKT